MEFQMFDHKAVAIEQLIPYALNSRTHSDEQVAQLAASIREFGFTNPVLVDEENNLIAGHGRVMAARKLGLKEVPAVIVTGLDDRKRRALIIADNKLALNAGWDEQALRVELEDLAADFGGLMGFSEDELAALLAAAKPLDEMPELANGDREPFRQMTFTLHDEQADAVERAIKKAKELGPFVDSENENGNGNALARICEIFLTKNGRPEVEYANG
jgi:ParB family chromosome partitioning protein